jgi:hypothetical protein
MAEPHKPGTGDQLEQTVISVRERPPLDETTFQQLLEAAHVLQEQKACEIPNRPRRDPTEALAQIVETQEYLRSQASDLQAASHVVVERLQKITHATGVAVAVVRENRLEYCAATGDAASLTGSSLPLDSSLSADGQLTTEFSREHRDRPSMALPLHHEGNLAGLLEIRFADADSIQEPEMRSCQLMAGLMTEAIARASDKEWRQKLAAERAAMLEALERIKPQLERLAVEPAKSVPLPAERMIETPESLTDPPAELQERDIRLPLSESSAKWGGEPVCPQCGYQFGDQELFCGRCGTARPSPLPSVYSHSKWASPWDQQQTEQFRDGEAEHQHEETGVVLPAAAEAPLSPDVSLELSPELKTIVDQFQDEPAKPQATPESESGPVIEGETSEDNLVPEAAATTDKSPWGSATKAHAWLESLHGKSAGGIWLAKHRADLYVGAAFLLLLIVLSGWGMRPAENRVQSKNPPQPSLTLFERLLVDLGLAETPPTPVYLGNPNAKVWVDLHTAQYYCADSDLYGKTGGGRFTTQRDAQMDQFEPAARKNCD